jgi:hypothetical protein
LLVAIIAIIYGEIGASPGHDIGTGWLWGGVAGSAAFAAEAALHNPITPEDADNIMVPLKAPPKQRLLSDMPGSRLGEHVGAQKPDPI